MPSKNFGLLGIRSSTPKIVRINGDDSSKIIYRNLGNNHAYPYIWAGTVAVSSGTTTVTIASGIKFHGYEAGTYATVSVTPNWNAGDVYITKNTAANTITATTGNAGADAGTSELDVLFMLGEDAVLTGFMCRGTGNPQQSY